MGYSPSTQSIAICLKTFNTSQKTLDHDEAQVHIWDKHICFTLRSEKLLILHRKLFDDNVLFEVSIPLQLH